MVYNPIMNTHKQVEALIDSFMKEQGWERLKIVNWAEDLGRPDRVYARGEDTVIMELKPEDISMWELQRGIGQALFFSLYKAKIYLVFEQSIWETFGEVLKLGLFGVFTYRALDKRFDMVIQQKAPLPGNIPLDVEAFKHREKYRIQLLREEVFEVVKEFKPGPYSMKQITESLSKFYPGRRIAPSIVGKHLMSMGFGKGYYNPETMERAKRSEGTAFYLINLHRFLGSNRALSDLEADTSRT